jgi:osmotically-inducible protein OsmY
MRSIFSIAGVLACMGLACSIIAAPNAKAAKQAVTSLSISDTVEDELIQDKAVKSYMIDVQTTDGVVTLDGKVSNLLAKERAKAIAETVKGVRSVVNKIDVVPGKLRSDWEIREDVKDALLMDSATESYEIDVGVHDGTVTLTGTVDSWQEREMCEKVAKGVKGIKQVKNEVVVDYKETRPDFDVKMDVKKGLRWDVLVDHALIEVSVEDGEVILAGVVGSAAEKSQAVMDAFVAGAKTVDSTRLEVRRWARDEDLKGDKYKVKSEEEIRAAVKDALFYDPRVASYGIQTEVYKDTVTLRGTVNNLKAKRAAAQDARNTVGVRYVENRIKVRPRIRISDEKVENRIERAFIRHPYLEEYELSASVVGGIADLYGRVDSYFEKAQAEDLASRVRGVVYVDNNITVEERYSSLTYKPYVDEWRAPDFDWYYFEPEVTMKRDGEIKEEIKDELFWSPFVDADEVFVRVEEGVATLTGTVDSWTEYNAATENAYEGGATKVNNQLAVANY